MIYQDHAIKGWMSQACLEWLYQQAGKMRTIVEIGRASCRERVCLLV